MLQDVAIDFEKVPPALIPPCIQEMMTLFGPATTAQIYRAVPKGVELEIDKKMASPLYSYLANAVGAAVADEFFRVYAGAALILPRCHQIRLWARNEVIRHRAESLYREGWSSRLTAYLLGWEFGVTAKSLHGIINMYPLGDRSSLSAAAPQPIDLASLTALAAKAPPPVAIDLAKVPADKLPTMAWLIMERLGIEDATIIINQVPGVSELLALQTCHEPLRQLLAGRIGEALAGRLLQAFAGEALYVPRCHQARLWWIEQAIAAAIREQGGCLDEQTSLHLAASYGLSTKVMRRIVRKVSAGHTGPSSRVATWRGCE